MQKSLTDTQQQELGLYILEGVELSEDLKNLLVREKEILVSYLRDDLRSLKSDIDGLKGFIVCQDAWSEEDKSNGEEDVTGVALDARNQLADKARLYGLYILEIEEIESGIRDHRILELMFTGEYILLSGQPLTAEAN